MFGPTILARSLSEPAIPDKYGNTWQYHSRSDRHSKIACWSILFDLLLTSPLLVEQVRKKQVAFGINHQMRDFKQNRKKDLDLVLCTPGEGEVPVERFADLVAHYRIKLAPAEAKALAGLPVLERAPVGAVHLALEAKACMTAHVRALPRLYDELNSSHLTVHGASEMAIAAGFVMINTSGTFASSDMNKHDLTKLAPNVSRHKQPADAIRAIDKVKEIPRRSKQSEEGFDALAIVLIECVNDGSKVNLVTKSPAPPSGDIFEYASMISRLAHLYEGRFSRA